MAGRSALKIRWPLSVCSELLGVVPGSRKDHCICQRVLHDCRESLREGSIDRVVDMRALRYGQQRGISIAAVPQLLEQWLDFRLFVQHEQCFDLQRQQAEV